MRLLTRRIYRAFPELDRYDDEQCIRFLRSARGGPFRRLAGCIVQAVVAAPIIVGSIMGVVAVMDVRNGRFDPMQDGPVLARLAGLIGFFAIMSPGPLAAILVRDVLLRRRVRYVLRTRGVCQSCWYSLVGLPVGAGNRVQCPECGMEAEVDPSLGELVVDPEGRTRYKPEFTPPHDYLTRFWNPARIRIVRRTALWILAIIIIGGGGTIGGYEIFLRRQAASALAAMLGQKGLNALPARFDLPQPEPDEDDPWQLLVQIDAVNNQIGNERARANPGASTMPPQFTFIYAGAAAKAKWGAANMNEATERAAVRDYLKSYETTGVYGLLDRLAATRGCRVIDALDDFGNPFGLVLPGMNTVYFMLPACIARAKLAIEDNDRVSAASAIEHALAIFRLIEETPFPYGTYFAMQHESAIHDRITESLMPPVSAEWLETLTGILDRQDAAVPPEYHAEVERFWAAESVAWVFSDPDRVRLGKHSSQLAPFFGTGVAGAAPAGRLGTYSENNRVVQQRFDAIVARAKQEPWQRTTAPAAPPAGAGLILPTMWMFGWSTSMSQEPRDIGLLRRRGIRAMIAIERYRFATGRYPGRLADLVPAYSSEVPRDPFTNKPLGYRLTDPAADPHGRGYLLYSIGIDGVDDNGAVNPSDPFFPLKPASGVVSTTYDYVINEPPPK